jgi:signal transduction histidine kinase/CheY-like chemotaxis protein/HAMP domain-containing protein
MPRAPRVQPIGPAVASLPLNGHSRNGPQGTSDLVDQSKLLAALRGVRAGDFGVRLPLDWTGVPGTISEVFNEVVELNERLTRECERISRTVGQEGKTEQRASLGSGSGSWANCIESINLLIADLTQSHADVKAQLSDLKDVATDRDRVLNAVARGDLSQRVILDIDGRPLEGAFLRSGQVVNSMIQSMAIFADQVATVAREVGTEGKLGGQAAVPGADGSWKAVTDTVNSMAANLTRQVRNIAEVTTAVANGDLSKKITVVVSGEIGALAETINSMGDTLATMADQVTTVAREVGTQGKLGGQAQVTGVDGTWKSLTDSVNMMAANLTAQVRAIGEVSTAVTKGDLSRSINVEAQGEIGQLKDSINEMISNLRVTTNKSTEQDWLKTSLARFTRTLQGQRELRTVGNLILSELAVLVNAQHGVLYVNKLDNGQPLLQLVSTYAYRERKALAQEFRLGEGLVGQCAYEKSRILLSEVPGDYVRISSGLGTASPLNIVVLPVLFEGDVKAVIELASFDRFSDTHLSFLDQLTESVGVVMNTISATARTEELLTQSQALSAERLQTNDQLEQKAKALSEQNEEVERQKQGMDVATAALQQKAEQLALTSKYKSQFLANMSHELRTPLNSMLILSEQLSANDDQNLTPRQVEFATTILGAGNDLLALINDILDLSKIESGMMSADLGEVTFDQLEDSTRQTFEPVARTKRLVFAVDLKAGLPRSIHTDSARLQQVLNNLLSNAFKFTERGSVKLAVGIATEGWRSDNENLNRAGTVISFAVADTGIGIPADKQAIIFEAFQQADMTTSRRFGGTGLGLSISREIATLLGGEIGLTSQPRQGTCFTLYLPLRNRRSTDGAVVEPEAPSRPRPLDDGGAYTPRLRAPVIEVKPEPPSVEMDPEPDVVSDDRDTIQADDKVLLIVDDDLRFTRTLSDVGHARGFKCLIALRGATALSLARKFNPAAVTLDIWLPDLDGWKVLDALKNDASTRHIPVHVISVDDRLKKALELGAVGGLTKPVTKKSLGRVFDLLENVVDHAVKDVLLVENDADVRAMMVDLIGNDNVQLTEVSSGEEALGALDRHKFDCVVIGLDLRDMTGVELISRMKQAAPVAAPLVVYRSREFTSDEEVRLRTLSETLIVKDVSSPERLLDETSLFLHRSEASLPDNKRALLEKIHRSSPAIAGKKVLIVDDDVRNIFALTSALERHDMIILNAESGAEAIALLRSTPDIDAVLMDIMMPEMDGFEVMRSIRADSRFAALPIIAVTAKAMKADRDQCIEAGASDYISKPVNVNHLVSLLRVWLTRR